MLPVFRAVALYLYLHYQLMLLSSSFSISSELFLRFYQSQSQYHPHDRMGQKTSRLRHRFVTGRPNELCKDDDDWNDEVRKMEEEAKFIMEAEPEYRYYSDTEKNGKSYIYYPICLGEVLNGRYQIEHKLGHGRFSTVWMAHDLRDKKDVALKIMATTRDGKSPGEHEMRIHDEIRQIPGVASDRLVTYLDTFVVSTSNGRNHRVLVLPFLAPCPDIVALGKLSMATRMSAAKQLLEALEALHTAGIVHRGEFS